MQWKRIELYGQLHVPAVFSRGGSRAGLEALEESNIALLCRESNCDPSVVQPTGTYSPYGLLNHEIEGAKVYIKI